MNNLIFLILFNLLFINVMAANIDGPANLRDKPNGRLICSINDNQYVYAYDPKNNWFKITVNVKIKKSDMPDKNEIPSGVMFYGNDLKAIIGSTKAIITDEFIIGPSKDDFFDIAITCYTYKNNLKPGSLLERELERIISTDSYHELKGFYEKFDFRENEVDEYTVWYTYDTPSPWHYNDFRIIIYFDSDKNIIGIANINRRLQLNNILESTIDRNYRMQYLQLPNGMERTEFEEKMTRAFAARD